MTDRPQIVGTWGARSAAELLGVFRGPGAAAADVIEVRIDLPDDGPAHVRELVAASPKPVLATCRRRAEGGRFAAGERDRIDVLLRAGDAGAAWIDVEDDVTDRDVERIAGTGAKLLRSRHVATLPDDAESTAEQLVSMPGDAAKFVALHGGADDALRMLTILRDVSRGGVGRLCGHVVDVPFTRPASAVVGAPFVYAALQPGGRIGLAMPTVLGLRRRARWDRLRPGRPIFLLLGARVEGSVGPDMLNAAFEATGPSVVALTWSLDDPAPAIEAIRRFRWAGAAVTIPHKERVLASLRACGARAAIDADADAVGAVNTIVRAGETLAGHNTDLGGLADALALHADTGAASGRAFLVLGAGGAARAAVTLASRLGARPIVFARRPEAAAALGAVTVATAHDAAATRPAIVVDATPAGPPGGTPCFDPGLLPERAVVLDMLVYARPTAMLASAARAGHVVVPGLAMLVAQAARQVVLLGGAPPDVRGMRAVGERALRRRDAPIVLVGLRCSGKSTVGERLAAVLGRTFHDTDREIEHLTGQSVEAMLRAGEEPRFRALEDQVLRAALDVPGAVVACGGGAALHAEAFAALAAFGTVVLLDAPDGVLLARRAVSPRAALTTLSPAEELAGQRDARMSVYRAAARLEVDVASLDAQTVADRVAAWWDADAAAD
ncbi:MAG: type I 3-dehydroquinate dehydratase [Planctomycetes bacterium]|nr:type I 3-dehydroquinate dehydratase [Planctomycetota bacterium]